MRTPAGKECSYFYGDYFRGRTREECRLLSSADPPLSWRADLCNTCPVPDIHLANACSHMKLEPYIERPFPFLKRRVDVKTYCDQTNRKGFDPHIGCGQCHPLPLVFTGDNS